MTDSSSLSNLFTCPPIPPNLTLNSLLYILTGCYYSYVSPRHRAQRTVELLHLGCGSALPWKTHRDESEEIRTKARVEITEDIREWDYGDYEGLTSKQIKEMREKNGEPVWNIWRDGCPGGEYVLSHTIS
jgi:sedoheptulose-bisphosphatase